MIRYFVSVLIAVSWSLAHTLHGQVLSVQVAQKVIRGTPDDLATLLPVRFHIASRRKDRHRLLNCACWPSGSLRPARKFGRWRHGHDQCVRLTSPDKFLPAHPREL